MYEFFKILIFSYRLKNHAENVHGLQMMNYVIKLYAGIQWLKIYIGC